jgi:hypothetical protein
MKKLIIICFLLCFNSVVIAGWDGTGSWVDDGTNTTTGRDVVVGGSATFGDTITQTGVEYDVLVIRAADDGELGKITFECSVLTDGSEVCQFHFYVVSDTPGTLTEEFTIDVDSD